MGTEARNLYVVLSAQTSGFRGQMVGAGATVKQFGSDVINLADKSARALHDLGRRGGTAGLAAAAGLAAVSMAAVQWESDFAGVQKTVNGTTEQINQLEGELREMARTMPATHTEIAATAEAAGQLGVATEDIAEFTRVMIMMGESTNLTADDAATSIAQFMNIMQTVPDQVDEIGNTIVALGNKGASTEQQIVDMVLRLGGAGSLLNASEADTLGLASAMANLGIQSELGGGAIQRTSLIINSAVLDGGDKLRGFADLAGSSADEFAAKWQADPMMALQDLITGLGGVKAEGGDLVKVLSGLGIKGTQNLQVLLRLAGSGDMLATSLGQARDAWAANSALEQEYARRAGTDASKIQVAWNQIKDAAIDAGEIVLPVIADIAKVVGVLADAFGGLPDPVQDAVVAMLAITAILGGGAWFGAKVVGGIRSTKLNLAALRGETAATTGGLLGTRGALQGVLADLRAVAAGWITTSSTAAGQAAKMQGAAARSRLGTAAARGGAGAAGIGLMAASMSGADVPNTAMLGLLGTMLLPGWGTAAGVIVGALMDLSQANNDLEDSTKRVNDAFSNEKSTLAERASAYEDLVKDAEAATLARSHSMRPGNDDGALQKFKDGWLTTANLISDADEKAQEARDHAEQAMATLGESLATIGTAMGDTSFADGSRDLDDLGRVAESIQPALDALGLTLDDLSHDNPINPLDGGMAVAAIVAYNHVAESAAGKTDALADAFGGIDNEVVDLEDRVKALKEALDSLLGVNLSLSAATDKWSAGLRDLKKDLKDAGAEGVKNIFAKGAGGEGARSVIRERITELEDLLTTMASHGEGPGKLARTLEAGAAAIVRQGKAAGLAEPQLRQFLRQMGLTPTLIETVFSTAGVNKAEHEAQRLAARYNKLPRKVRVDIKQNGFPKSKAEVEELTEKYHLTPKQVETILKARDSGTVTVKGLQALLGVYDRSTASAALEAVDHASTTISAVLGGLFHIDGFVAKSEIITHHSNTYGGPTGDVHGHQAPDPETPDPDGSPRGSSTAGGHADNGHHGNLPPKQPPIHPRGVAGGRYGSQSGHRSDKGGNVTVHARMPDRMTLEVDGHEFTAYVRSHAHEVAVGVVDSSDASSTSSHRGNWS